MSCKKGFYRTVTEFFTKNWSKKKAIAFFSICIFISFVIYFLFFSGPRLTEDYLPHIPGRVRKYNNKDYTNSLNSGMHIATDKPDGLVQMEKINGLRFIDHWRNHQGFLELGDKSKGRVETYLPLVKIGSRLGDTWKRTSANDPNYQFVYSFSKIFSHQGKPCVVIQQKEYVKDKHHYTVDYWLLKGVGIIHRESFRFKNNQWKLESEISFEEW